MKKIRCSCDDDVVSEFEDLFDKRGMSCTFNGHLDNFVGQRLKGEAGDLKNVTWIKTTRLHSEWAASAKPSKPIYPTVEHIETTCVHVNWLYCGSGSTTQPPTKIMGEEIAKLKLLNCFENCETQIGDIYFYTLKKGDEIRTVLKSKKKSYIHYILKDIPDCVHTKEVFSKSLTKTEVENAKNVLMRQYNEKKKSENAANHIPDKNGDSGEVSKMAQQGSDSLVSEKSSYQNDVKDQTAGQEDVTGQSASCGAGDVNDVDGDCKVDGNDDEYEDVANESDADSVASSSSAMSNSSSHGQVRRRRGIKKGGVLQTKLMKKKGKPPKPRETPQESVIYVEGQRVAVEVIWTTSYADVIWQDCSEEHAVSSSELYPIHHLDENEFFPGDYVLENISSGKCNYGFIVKVSHCERTCHVKWVELDNSARVVSISSVQELSVYDIKDHPDYKFRPGNVVVKLDVDNNSEAVSSQTVGQVFRLVPGEGRIEVEWHDGSRTVCGPQELYLMPDDDDFSEDESDWESCSGDDSMHGSSSEGSDGSWETESEGETDPEEAGDGENQSSVTSKKSKLPIEGQAYLQLKLEPIVKEMYEESKQVIIDTMKEVKDQSPTLYGLAEYLKEIQSALQRVKLINELLEFHIKSKKGLSSVVGKASVLLGEILNLKEGLDVSLPSHLKDSIIERLEILSVVECGVFSDGATNDNVQNTAVKSKQEISDNTLDTLVDQVVNSLVTASDGSLVMEVIDKFIKDSVNDTSTPNLSAESGEVSQAQEPVESLSDGASTSNGTEDEACLKTDAGSENCNTSGEGDSGFVQEPSLDESVSAIFLKVSQLIPDVLECLVEHAERLKSELCNRTDKLDREQYELQEEVGDKILDIYMDHNLKNVHSILHRTPDLSLSPRSMADRQNPPMFGLKLDNEESRDMKPGDVLEEESRDQNSANEKSAIDISLEDSCLEPEGLDLGIEGFKQLDTAPLTHRFIKNEHKPDNAKAFMNAVRKELKLLRTSLPHGILVRCYEDRMDLVSVLITGPAHTPYEDGLFAFDFQLPNGYNSFPPLCHYLSYCTNRLNPNLYEDGKVCISLLGTWTGKGNEVWTTKSNLLQVLVSIQGLILVPEPYYNEAGYEKQRGGQQALENSKMYNEMALIKMVQSMSSMVRSPPDVFREEVHDHFKKTGRRIMDRLNKWLELSDRMTADEESTSSSVGHSDHSNENPNKSSILPKLEVTSNNLNEPSSENSTQTISEQTDGACYYVKSTCLEEGDERGDVSSQEASSGQAIPEFPLLPVSKGCKLSLLSSLEELRKALEVLNTS